MTVSQESQRDQGGQRDDGKVFLAPFCEFLHRLG